MRVGNKIFIIKTLGGEYVGVRSSEAWARSDVAKAEANGHKCVVIEATVDAIHTTPTE
jgi:hypothetical protein